MRQPPSFALVMPTNVVLLIAVLFVALVAAYDPAHGPINPPDPAALGFEPLPIDFRVDNVELQTMGVLPGWLRGSFYRGAPGQWPDGWWLDGLITLNVFRFSGKGVSFAMRWSEDHVFNHTRTGSPLPSFEPKAKYPGALPLAENVSFITGVAFHQVDGKLLGTTGTSAVNEIDPHTLAPLAMPFAYKDKLGAPFLAPTHTVTVDGHVLHHLVRLPGVHSKRQSSDDAHEDAAASSAQRFPRPSIVVTSIAPGSTSRTVLAEIVAPKESSPWLGSPSFQHMPLATPTYYVMLEAPCYYPLKSLPFGRVNWKGFSSNPLAGTHVRLVHRQTGNSTVFRVSHNLFAIHHLNAYEDPTTNSLVLDTIKLFPSIVPCSSAFADTTLHDMTTGWKDTMSGYEGTQPLRLTLPLDRPGAAIEPQPIGAIRGIEFPTIRPDRVGRRYRYAYACYAAETKAGYYDALMKLDVVSGTSKVWKMPRTYPGEPIFVADPRGATEDAGVVLSNVLNATSKQTFLIVLNATTMQLIARVGPTPHAIPHGFHGTYIPDI